MHGNFTSILRKIFSHIIFNSFVSLCMHIMYKDYKMQSNVELVYVKFFVKVVYLTKMIHIICFLKH